MADTLIEWTDKVWNPVTGCGPGLPCYDRCYARRFATRLAGRYGYPPDDPFRVTFHPDRLELPLRWRKPCRVFVDSMGDLFHDDVSTDVLDRAFAVMGRAFWHTFQILTKRPSRMRDYINDPTTPKRVDERAFAQWQCEAPPYSPLSFRPWTWPLPNVWLGVSVEDQKAADEHVPALLKTEAALRFVSCEPLLGPLNLIRYLTFEGEYERAEDMLARYGVSQPLSWVIVGGENGPGARPCHPDWLRSLRDQCVGAKVPFFFKGYGAWRPPNNVVEMADFSDSTVVMDRGDGWPAQLMVRHGTYPLDQLDGRQWKEMPTKEDE